MCLLLLVESTFAQTLKLPPRAPNALDGKSFTTNIAALGLAEREREIFSQVTAGSVPEFLRRLCPVTVTNIAEGQTNVATFFVTPDYLAIGSDEDYFLTPMSPSTAQRIADQLGCLLPTRKMVDAIYASAEVKLAPSPIPPSVAMTTVPVFAQHNEMVRTQRWNADLRIGSVQPHPDWPNRSSAFRPAAVRPPGALVAGHKKDVVISARLASVTNRVAIYG